MLVPWAEPKFAPVIVTGVPAAPRLGDKPVILGAAATVKATPLLGSPKTVTTTFPVVAPLGTGVTIPVPFQPVGVAMIPLKVTRLDPCVAPKFVPLIVTEVPTEPDVVERLVILGVGVVTVKFTPLLAAPDTVTTTLPDFAPLGTGTPMLVILQLVGEATTPLNVTLLVPCVAPKFVPVTVTAVLIAPDVGDRLVMLGGVATVKVTPLLATPPTVTTTGPVLVPLGTEATMVVAFQVWIVFAGVPLNVTVLVPWLLPKFAPLMVTEVPASPKAGDNAKIPGT